MSLQKVRLQKRLGYEFADDELFALALTHRSVHKTHNYERLEFLGDALLSSVIAEALYLRFTGENEGRLTRMRATLVRQETLAQVAQDLQLGEQLNLGSGELKAGGRKRASILSDVVEALIGAIYLDSGDYVLIQRIVLAWFAPYLDKVGGLEVLKDAKSRLQELLQGQNRPLPVYVLDKVQGKAPDEVFFVLCQVEGQADIAAVGSSRRIAEQVAAEKMLVALQPK